MSRAAKAGLDLLLSFPRVSGDEPEAVQGQGLVGEFSPRERG